MKAENKGAEDTAEKDAGFSGMFAVLRRKKADRKKKKKQEETVLTLRTAEAEKTSDGGYRIKRSAAEYTAQVSVRKTGTVYVLADGRGIGEAQIGEPYAYAPEHGGNTVFCAGIWMKGRLCGASGEDAAEKTAEACLAAAAEYSARKEAAGMTAAALRGGDGSV